LSISVEESSSSDSSEIGIGGGDDKDLVLGRSAIKIVFADCSKHQIDIKILEINSQKSYL
jgi:hypothetical protein